MFNNSRFPERDVTWRPSGPSVHAPGDGLEGAYSAMLHTAPSGGTCKVIVPALSLTDWRSAFCSQAFTGHPGDMVLVMFDENKEAWVISPTSVVLSDNDPIPPGHEWAYAQSVTPLTVTATTEVSQNTFLTVPAFVPDGQPVMVDFWCPYVENGPAANSYVIVTLWEGSTQVTRLLVAESGATSASTFGVAVAQGGRYRFTPSAASHSYTIQAWGGGLTAASQVGAGNGVGANYPPAFVRFTKV